MTSFQLSAQVAAEYQLKAAFIFNFLQFVEWPSQSFPKKDAPILVGILGNDPFGREIDSALKGRNIGEHPIVIRRYANVDKLQSCHVLFISRSERDKVPQIVSRTADKPVFTISDIEDFASRGGVLNFLMEDNKLRFEINLNAAKRGGLQISSKLLRLAKIVETKGG